jgi:hypothetical protein
VVQWESWEMCPEFYEVVLQLSLSMFYSLEKPMVLDNNNKL